MFYMPTGEFRDSDAIRVCFEFRDSSFMDSGQIINVLLLKGAYMTIREILDIDAIPVYFEFRDSSFMDSCRIKYAPLILCALYAYR